MEKHSWFSPSKAHRLLACPASVVMEDKGEPSEYAEDGTQCHKAIQELDEIGTIATDLSKEWQKPAVEEALKQRNSLFPKDAEPKLYLETRVDLSAYGHPDIFGTADCICKIGTTVYVIDYKFGKGVPIGADWNPQLLIYAAGAMRLFQDVEEFQLVIIQPRIYKEPWVWPIAREKLEGWIADKLLPGIKKAKAAKEGKIQPDFYNPSEDTCRWCPGNPCGAANKALFDLLPTLENAVTDATVDVGGSVTTEDIATILSRADEIRNLLRQAEARAVAMLERGVKIPGFKLVRRLGNTTWVDEKKANNFLARKKLKEKERHVFKLVSPTKAKKLLKERNALTERTLAWFAKNTFRPERGFVVAPESDPREAVEIELPTETLEDIL